MVTRKTTTKTKAAALTVPQSIDEANDLVAEYGDLFNEGAHLEADMNAELAAVKAKYEERAKPGAERMAQIFDALNAFAGANRKQLTNEGKTKTVKLAAGEIGWRMNPPSVRWARGFNAEKIVQGIKEVIASFARPDDSAQRIQLRAFIRTKEEPDKNAMSSNPDLAKTIPGVRIGSSGEQFFIAPFGAELSEAKP